MEAVKKIVEENKAIVKERAEGNGNEKAANGVEDEKAAVEA